jgi:hypothetical protein
MDGHGTVSVAFTFLGNCSWAIMTSALSPDVTKRNHKVLPVAPRPWAGLKGVALGLVMVIPAIGLAVWTLSLLGIGQPDLDLVPAVRGSALFAGVAAALTSAGIARLAAQAAVLASRRRAVWVAARAGSAAGAGLTVIAIIPHGSLPGAPAGWLAIAAVGAAYGALALAVVGYWAGAPTVTEGIKALAQLPSDALRVLLESRDRGGDPAAPRRRRRITVPFLFGGADRSAPDSPPPPPASSDPEP